MAIPELSPGTATETSSATQRGSGMAMKLMLGVAALVVVVAVVFFLFKPPEKPLDQAIALIKSNKHAAALPILEEITRTQPENTEVLPWLAQGYLHTDRIAEGRTALDTALKLKLPCAVLEPVILAYSGFYQAKNDFSEAEKLFASVDGSCRSSTQVVTGMGTLYVHWADFESQQGDHTNALKHYQLAHQLLPAEDPQSAGIAHKISDMYRQMAAVAEIQDKDDKKAIALLESGLQVSDEPLSRMALGSLYQRAGNKEKAIENYVAVSKGDPNNLEVRHRLIDLYLETNNIDGARQALLELTEKERSVENFDLLANLNLKKADYPAAVRALEDAIMMRPKDMPLLSKLEKSLLEWSALLTKQGKSDESISVKGHADRITDMIKEMQEEEKAKLLADKGDLPAGPTDPPVSLVSSRVWLAKGSFTPEGEVTLKNISGQPVTDLNLTFLFYDNTTRKKNGTITQPCASASHPIPIGSSKRIWFSSPQTVKREHQLTVIVFWNNRLLKEFPVVKER